MHRGGLRHISSTVSGSHVLMRCAHGDAATSSKFTKSTRRSSHKEDGRPTLPPLPKDRKFVGPVDGGRRPPPKFRNVPKNVRKDVRDVINAYARDSHSTTSLERSVQSVVPSQTKTQFFAEPEPELEADYGTADDLAVSQSVLPGTFIELRRNWTTTHGVVLGSSAEGLRRMTWTITSSGEIFKHLAADITFTIPNSVDRAIAAACCDFSSVPDENSTPDLKQTAARVKVLKEIRSLEREIESRYHTVAMRIGQALPSAPWSHSNEWEEVLASEVADLVGARSQVDRLCVHKYLMAHHDHFIANTVDFLNNQKFWIRPKCMLEDLRLVTSLIAQRDLILDTFAEKARALVASAQERRASPSASSLDVLTNSEFSFSPEEQTIIRVLLAFVRSTRSIQKDPYVIPVATIMKRIGLYDVQITTAVVHQLLIDLGTIAPWDDPVSRERALVTLPPRTDPLALPFHSTLSGPNLGPDEFYTHDIVEHVRHDFKDLPAFVIDDIGAQELDDAVSLERIPAEPNCYWIHTHVADPTAKIHPWHSLAQQARLRFTTAYDIHRTIPMIPSSIMYDGLSLGSRSKQGLPENVLTFSAKVDEHGDIVDYKVRAGLLRNVKVVKYDEVDKLLDLPPIPRSRPFESSPIVDNTPLLSLPPDNIEDLRILHNLALKLINYRFTKAGLWWSIPSASVSMSTRNLPPSPSDLSHPSIYSGYPDLAYEVSDQQNMERGARQLVAECMKAACRVASRFFLDRNIPFVRRASSQPYVSEEQGGLEAILAMRRHDGFLDVETVLKSSISVPRGEYTLEPRGHFLLGVPDGEGYVRVTSPLRRYSDIVAHWQIKHALAATGGLHKPLFDSQWLTQFAREMTAKETALKVIERRHNQFWNYRFLERWQANARNHPDRPNPLDSTDALVTKPPDSDTVFHRPQATVMLPALGVSAKLDAKDLQLKTGDRVTVKYGEIALGMRPEFVVTRV